MFGQSASLDIVNDMAVREVRNGTTYKTGKITRDNQDDTYDVLLDEITPSGKYDYELKKVPALFKQKFMVGNSCNVFFAYGKPSLPVILGTPCFETPDTEEEIDISSSIKNPFVFVFEKDICVDKIFDIKGVVWNFERNTNNNTILASVQLSPSVFQLCILNWNPGREKYELIKTFDWSVYFRYPPKITYDPVNGILYATDYQNDTFVYRILYFDFDGASLRYLNSFGSAGSEDGQFHYQTDIKYYQGSLYICDAYNNRIQVFDSGRNFLRKIEFSFSPILVTFAENNMWVIDNGYSTVIHELSLAGEVMDEYALQFNNSGYISSSPENIYVMCPKRRIVYKLDFEGTLANIFYFVAFHDRAHFYGPNALFFDTLTNKFLLGLGYI